MDNSGTALNQYTGAGARPLALTSNVKIPLVIGDERSVSWSAEADIVVVGFGGAGVVAALQSRELGASVIVVDRFGGGGATAASGGVIYAGGTRHQRAAGFHDTAEEMYRYLANEGTPVRPETLRRFCETSNENIEWLESYGVQFAGTPYLERTAYPPDGFYLYYSGMEKFRDFAKAAPRGHRTVGKGPTGKFYFAALRAAAMHNDVKLMPHAPVRRLVVNPAGAVLGVEIQAIPADRRAEHQKLFNRVNPYKLGNGKTAEEAIAACRQFEASLAQDLHLIRARRGVILSAGGYNYNLELFARYRPIVKVAYKELVRGGSMGCDGSGIELGVTAGGAVSHMDRLFVTKAISPPNAFIYGVLVNQEGRRFITEDAYAGNVGCAVAEQSYDGRAFLILDHKTFWQGVRQMVWPLKNMVSWWGMPALLNLVLGGTRRASSLPDLARKAQIDAGILESTVREFNSDASKGTDPIWGKLPMHIRPLGKGPYYAFNLSLRNKWGFSGTMPYGGLSVDEESGAVTRADGSCIPGLYAAGRTAVGVCSESNFSGLSIADTVFSGRRAARGALESRAKHLEPSGISRT